MLKLNTPPEIQELLTAIAPIFKGLKYLRAEEKDDGTLVVTMEGGPQKGVWTHTIRNLDKEPEPEPFFSHRPNEWKEVCDIVFT
jgi:hypothetical protein